MVPFSLGPSESLSSHLNFTKRLPTVSNPSPLAVPTSVSVWVRSSANGYVQRVPSTQYMRCSSVSFQSGGIVGDIVVTRITRRRGGVRQPEYRLYALLPILPFMIIGLLIFGITFQNKTHWIGKCTSSIRRCLATWLMSPRYVAPLIGGAVFYYCIAASTGILQTVSSN
jgi:hypothetical protein